MINSKPYCQYLHEIENDLPRTKFCFIACRDQREILRDRNQEKKTKILIVSSGGEHTAAMAVQKVIADLKCDVEIITPEKARELKLEVNDSVVPIKNLIPKTYQYYPLSEVQKSRRERRAKKHKK